MDSSDARSLIRYGLAGLVLAVFIAWAMYLARHALLLVYISAIVAIGLSPLVNAAEQKGRRVVARPPRWLAALVVYTCILGILTGVGLMVVPPLVEQARALWKELPAVADRGVLWLRERGVLDPTMSVTDAIRQSPLGASDAVGTLVGAIWGFIGGVFGAVTILILSFYLVIDSRPLVRAMVSLFPRARRQQVNDACGRIAGKVSAWLGGQLLLAGIIGLTAAVGLWLFGVPYFYVLALIAALGEMIPVVGPVLSAIPAIVVGFSQSPALGVTVAVFFVAQQQIENHVLVPRIMARQVGVSPAIVVTSLLVGGSLLGVMGAIIALPTAAILQVLVQEGQREE